MTFDSAGDLGTVLGVWAHPDDETWLSAGLMALAIDAGRRVVCVTATKGEAGFPDTDPRTTAERTAVREIELAASLAALGVTEHRWLGYADGGCAAVPDDEGAAVVAALIAEVQPDTVLTFGPDGGTGHSDHVSVCRWTTMALDALAARGAAGGRPPRLLYSTKTREWSERFVADIDPSDMMMIENFEPEAVGPADLAVWLTCEGQLLDRKTTALRAQVSQIEPIVAQVGVDAFRTVIADEFFRERRITDAETLRLATEFSRRG